MDFWKHIILLPLAGCLLLTPVTAAQHTWRVSVDSAGAEANHASRQPVLSADGRTVAFYSEAGNLVPNDTNGRADVFVHDRLTGITERISVTSAGDQGNGNSHQPSMTPDGRHVVFTSTADDLVTGDTNAIAKQIIKV